MKRIFPSLLLICSIYACSPNQSQPEPHLELGQRITFNGSSVNKTYVIVGYRHTMEAEIDKAWNDHDYIVFVYINDINDVKQATIHVNAITKK